MALPERHPEANPLFKEAKMRCCLPWVAGLVAVLVTGGVCEPLLSVPNAPHNTLTLDAHHTLHLVHPKGEAHVNWGLTLPEGAEGTPCGEGDSCLDFGVARVVVTTEDHCQKVAWTSGGDGGLSELKDCVLLEGHWFGGGQQIYQPWPIEKQPREETAYVTADMLQKRLMWYGGVTEAYWVSSQGVAVRVEEETPLFLSVPDTDGDETADELCLSARHDAPFVAAPGTPLTLTYFLCTADDVRQVHEATFPKFFSLPDGPPDARMIRDPVWSTWAEYHAAVNDSRVLELARSITEFGFNNSQVEIDDNWETCYGEAVFNPERFPDPKGLVDQLHSEGFRVTLWIHPFINDDCPAFTYADQQGYLIKDSTGTTQLTHWWQGNSAGAVDFTNEDARSWWLQRILDLQQQTGIDSFKFDAGETSWLPENYTLGVDERLWPNFFTYKYVESVAQFGNMVETRVGRGSQRHAIFVRMLDKDSIWGYFNGISTLVPSLLHSGILGYPFVLPDMVGGNAYGISPSKELFVRWAQANAFMPAIQFSILPWNYDDETIELCREVTRLHAEYTPLLLSLADEATTSVAPMMRPTWWLCPTLEECLTVDQQFLVGDDLLAVPVVTADATTLDVVLPPGEWQQAGTELTVTGPTTITVDITLSSIVYFTRVTS
ncbi:myogenesis-regulating glycosidase-like isoform X2 [Eriocheir sinensis]|uniref:myogenesis-regulating glycosidase-like isoform X2 n=1 Tax=Eriocheir sinensis TaxID=95602 RepID=UPI0021C9051C|nr:myogenesis-regulating glycosidase-like isoform X2 [Eriocheir sinensis]